VQANTKEWIDVIKKIISLVRGRPSPNVITLLTLLRCPKKDVSLTHAFVCVSQSVSGFSQGVAYSQESVGDQHANTKAFIRDFFIRNLASTLEEHHANEMSGPQLRQLLHDHLVDIVGGQIGLAEGSRPIFATDGQTYRQDFFKNMRDGKRAQLEEKYEASFQAQLHGAFNAGRSGSASLPSAIRIRPSPAIERQIKALALAELQTAERSGVGRGVTGAGVPKPLFENNAIVQLLEQLHTLDHAARVDFSVVPGKQKLAESQRTPLLKFMAHSQEEGWLLVAGISSQILVYDLNNREMPPRELATPRFSTSYFVSAAYGIGNGKVVVASGAVDVLDIQTGAAISRADSASTAQGRIDPITVMTRVAVPHKDKSLFIAGTTNGKILFYEVHSEGKVKRIWATEDIAIDGAITSILAMNDTHVLISNFKCFMVFDLVTHKPVLHTSYSDMQDRLFPETKPQGSFLRYGISNGFLIGENKLWAGSAYGNYAVWQWHPDTKRMTLESKMDAGGTVKSFTRIGETHFAVIVNTASEVFPSPPEKRELRLMTLAPFSLVSVYSSGNPKTVYSMGNGQIGVLDEKNGVTVLNYSGW
jgi:hypothetical protein